MSRCPVLSYSQMQSNDEWNFRIWVGVGSSYDKGSVLSSEILKQKLRAGRFFLACSLYLFNQRSSDLTYVHAKQEFEEINLILFVVYSRIQQSAVCRQGYCRSVAITCFWLSFGSSSQKIADPLSRGHAALGT